MTRALEGIHVLDLTRMLPGPYASMILARLGARVTKIEDTVMGDPTRWNPRHRAGHNSTFELINRGKESLALDLKAPDGVEIFRRLARTADVVLEGFRPGVMHRLGIDYDSLRSLNPKLVYCSISGYGQDGPLRERSGHDVNYLALAGVLGLQTDREGQPVLSGIQVADLGGSLFAVIGVLAALAARARTGQGDCVDVSMMDVGAALLPVPAARLFAGESVPRAARLPLSGGLACYNIYATADARHISVGALETKFWERFCRVIGRDDFLPLHMEGPETQQRMIGEIRDIVRAQPLAYWVERFRHEDACVEPVLSLTEAFDAPQARFRRVIEEAADGVRQLGLPFKFSSSMPDTVTAAPRLGQHTRAILQSLGYSSEELGALVQRGVCKFT